MLRRQLEDNSAMVNEQSHRSKAIEEENEILLRRKEEVEGRLGRLEAEYEELLGEAFPWRIDYVTTSTDVMSRCCRQIYSRGRARRHEYVSSRSGYQSKPSFIRYPVGVSTAADWRRAVKNKLEVQYAMKLDGALNEVTDLKQQLELKAQENRSIGTSLEALRGANGELEVNFPLHSFPPSAYNGLALHGD